MLISGVLRSSTSRLFRALLGMSAKTLGSSRRGRRGEGGKEKVKLMQDRGLNTRSTAGLKMEKGGGESFPGQGRLPDVYNKTRSPKRGKSWTVVSVEE